MSAHRTKQSLDSHHLVVNQSETPKADEFHVAGDTNVPQPEGDTGPLSLSSSSHSSQSETQPLTPANRRKLGSRRRNKQQQHVTDSATKKQDKPREDLEGNTKCNQALETKQPERQEELNNQASEDDSSVTRGSSLWSSTTSGYSCEVQVPSTKNPEDIPEILILKSGNKQADKDEKLSYSYCLVETKLEVTGAAAFLQSEEIKENTASSSDLISSLSVTENEKRREEDSDLLRQDGNVEGNYLKGESHAQSIDTRFSTTPEVTTDKCNPNQNTEPADIKNENFSLHLDAQLQDCSVSTKENIDTNFSTSVNRRKLGSARRNKRRQHVKDPVTESEEEPVEKFAGFDFFETAIVSSLTETDVTSVETMLEGMNRSPTDEIEKKEAAHVGISDLNSSNFLPTSIEPLMNQSNVREMPHELASVYSETNAEGKEREEDADLSKPWGSFHGSDLTNEPREKSDLECPMNLEKPTEEDHGEHTEPEHFVELAIDSSPNEELSTYEEQNEHFSLSEVSGPHDLYEEEVKHAEIRHSFDGANSEICLANLTDQAEVGDSSRSESSVKGVEDSVTEKEVSKPDYKQDEPPEMQSNVEAFKQMNEDDQVYDPKKPETSDMEGLDTAVVQVYANEGQLEDDIKPSVEQTSHQEKGVPTDMTESKSPLESAESETLAPFDSQPQDTSLIIDDQNNTDFNPISNRRKLGSRRRNKRQKIVESPGVESEMSLMLDTEIQEISMQMMQEGMDKADPSQTEDVCNENQECAHSSHTGLSSVSVHSSSPVEQQVTEQPNSSASTHSPVTDTESKQDTDLLMRRGFLQADNSLYETHLKAESLESSTQPEITTEKSSYREHTWPKYGIEQVADSSPKEEMSTMMSQNEHLSSSEVGGTQHSEDVVEEVHNEAVKPIHIDDDSVEESNPCFQTLESETKSPLDSQPVDNSVSIKEETQSGFKLTGNRRKLGSSRRLKGRRHGPEITGPEEEVVENTCSDEEKTEIEKVPTGTINQEELKEQTSPDFNLTKKMTSAVEEQENTEEMPEEDTTLSLNMMDNRTTVTTDFLNTTEEVKEPENVTPLPVYDVFQMDLIQAVEASVWNDNSDSQNISNHDDNVTTKSIPSDLLDQEETSHFPNTESSPCDDDSAGRELCVRQTTDVNESEGDVLLNEAKSLMGALGSEEVDVEEERKDPFNKDHLAQETNTSIEVTPDEPFSVAQNETETFEIGPEENTRAKPAEKVGISPAADASNSRGETDNKDKTDQSNLDVEVDVRNLEVVEVIKELSSLVTKEENAHWSLSNVDKEKEINKTSSVTNDGQKLQSNTSDLQTIESNMIPNRDDSVALLPDQSSFHNEEFVNPAAFVHGTDVKAGEVDVDVSEEPTQQDDFRSNEMQTTSVVICGRSPSVNVLLPPNTEDAINTDSVIIEALQSDKQSPEGIKEGLTQEQPFNSVEAPSVVVVDQEMLESVIQEPNNAPEGAHKTNSEMKDSNPHVSPNRRRKMGSTRRNHGSRSKVENSHQEQTHTQSESVESSSQSEKSSYREHTDPKYGVEQVALSSPTEDMSPMERQNEHLSSSEFGGAQHSEDVVEEVHGEEVKPIHIDDSSVEESNPYLQTLESETKSPLDSQPVDNSVSIKEETQSGFKLTGNRRKLGSSRRLKGRRHGPEITGPEEKVVENTCSDEEKTEKETVPTGTINQEELKEQTSPDFNLTKKMTSAVEEQENTEEMSEEDTTLSLNMMDNRTTVKTDFLNSTEEVKEPEDLTPLPVFDVVQMDLIQALEASVWNDNSDSQNISNHVDNVTTKSVPSDLLDQEETSHIPSTESSPCDDDSAGRDICVRQTTDVNESEGDVLLNEAKSLMGALGSEEVDVEEERKDPFNEDHLAQETNTSIEVTPDEPFSGAQNETETVEIGLDENTRPKPAEKVGISPAADASNSRGETDNKDKTDQSNLDVEVDVSNLDMVEVMEELSSLVTKEENAHWSLSNVDKEKEINKTSSVHNDGQKLQSNTSDLQTIESNMIPNRDDSVALLPDQSLFHNEEFVNPAAFVHGTDVNAGEVDVDVSEEPTQQDDFRSNEMQTTSVVICGRSPSVNVLLAPSTEDAINTDCVIIEAIQSDKQSPEGIKEGLTQEQPFNSVEAPSVVVVDQEMLESVIQEPNNAPEGAHKTNSEMKDSNPHVSPNRRRKMGSTRRNHGSRSKVENSHQEPTHTQSESVESSNQSEKISYREHTESKYGVEQEAVLSPQEDMSPMERQNEYLSSSEVGGAQHCDDVGEEVHEEEVKPIHMQTMHQIDDSSVEESNPCLQTLESETKSPFDSQHVDNSVSIKEETQSGFKLTGNRRKLGSSRRLKGRRHGPEITGPEEKVVENTCSDEAKTEKETVPTGTINQEELKEQTSPDFNLTKKMTSAVEEQENTEEMPEEDTSLSLNMMDNRTTVTTDFLNSTEEVKEPEDLTPLPVFDVAQMDLIQAVEASVWNDNSDSQNISNHDDNVTTKSVPSDLLDQEETSHIPKTESSPCDDDSAGRELCVRQTTDVNESEGDVLLNEATSLMGALGSEEVDVEEERKDPFNEDHLAQETNTSIEVTPDEPFSGAQNETETFEIGLEENTRPKPAEKVGISPAADASNSRGETDNKDKTDQSNLDVEVDVRNLEVVEVIKELSSLVTKEENSHWSLSNVDKEKEINKTSSVTNDGQKLQSNTSDLQTIESNMIPNRDDSVALLPDQSSFHNEEFVNPAAFVHGTDVKAGEVDVDVSEEPTQQDDFRSNEMQTTSVVICRRSPSINVLLPPNTEDAINTDSVIIEALQSDKQSPEGIKEGLTQEQPFNSVEVPSVVVVDQETLESVIQEPNNAPEGAHKTNSEMKDSNPHVSPNRRRKMGSTRRNHGSRSKVENSHQEQTHTQSESVESPSQSEKISYREHTDSKYGVEQVALSSPTEDMSPMERQNEHLSSSEVGGAQHSEDVVEEVHGEEVKPIHIDDSSVEESNPYLQTLESETKSPFDSQPVDNSVSIKEETQSGFKLTGNRRKLGSSRRLKGRRHGPEITGPEEEVVENSCSDEENTEKETVPTGTINQEELKAQTSPDFNLTKKITSAVEEQENTEEMPKEDTTLSLNMMDNRTTVTTDFLNYTEEVKEPEDLTPLPVFDVAQMDLIQALEASVWNDNSDSQNISNHDDNVTTKSIPSDLLDQEETSHFPNTESSPCDDDSAGRELCVRQTTDVNESEGDVLLNEAKSLMGALGSEEVDVEEERKDPFNEDHLAQETNTSIEVTSDEPFSVAQNETETFEIGPEENTRPKPAEKVGISPAADASNSRGETDNKDKTDQSNLDVEVDVSNLDMVEVMEELSSLVTKEENSHWSLSNVDKEKEINKTSSVHNDGQKLQSNTSDLQTIESNMIPNRDDSVALLPDQSSFHNEEFVNPAAFVHGTDVKAGEVDVDVSEESTQQDDFRSNEMQTTSVVIGRRSPSINVLLSSPTELVSPMESQNEHLSSSEVGGAQHFEDVLEEVHDEEVKPMHIDDSSVEESNPCVQTLESEAKSPFDSQPVDNSVSIKEETQSGFKLTGNRRKLGSSRRLKGRRHGPEITGPEEEVVENTCSDEEKTEKETVPTGTINQEELKEQTSPDFHLTKKMTSAVEEQENTEEMPKEDTTLSLNMMDNRTTVTTDFLNSTKEVKEPEDFIPLPVYDVVQMDLVQSVEITSAVEDSVIIEATQSDKQSPEGIKEGLIQDQPLKSVEVPSVVVVDQEMLESVIQEPNNAPEGAHKTNSEMKDSNPHVSPIRRRKMGSTRRNHGSRSKVENSHQEQTHTQSESVESPSQSEKSSYREHTESKYGVEQLTFLLPQEEMSPIESQNEHLSSSEVGAAQHCDHVVGEVHEEEVKPIHMQTMHQIDDSSVEESNPCLQTLESETKSPFDSQPVDNSLSIKEETQSGFKLTGNRRKLGSSRRLKGRRHGPEITGPEEKVVENTCSDEEKTEKETVPTGTINQEELKEQTSPDFNLTKKMTSAVEEQENTEEMPEEDTSLSLNMMDNRTTVTTDFLNSTKEVKEPEDLTPLPVYDVVQMDLVQSMEITSAVEDSVIIEATQSDKQSPEGIKEGLIQDQPLKSVEVPSVVVVDQETLESVIQEPNNAPEGAHKTNSEMKDSDPHVSPNRRRKMGSTRRNHGSRSKVENSHQEQTHTQSESVESPSQSEKSSYREHTESKYGVEQFTFLLPQEEMSPIESQNEHLSSSEVGAAQHCDDVVGEVHEEEVKPIHMQTMHQIDDSSVEESNPCLQTLESETKSPFDSKPVDNSLSIKEETQSGFKLTGNRRKLGSSRRLKGRRHGPEITGPEEKVVENTCSDEEKTEKETVPTGTINQEELKAQTSPDFNLTKKITSAVEDSAIIEATQSGKQSPEGIKEGLIQDQPFKSVEAPSVVVVDHETLESVIQEPNNTPEGAHKTSSEMKDSSPHVSSPNRRRKMGSTRRNHGSRSKVENSNQKQELDKEDVYSESFSVIAEKEPPINDQQESSDSEQRKEKVFETVELSHTGESQGKSPARQTLKENPDSLSQQAETEPHLTPDHLTALSPHDVTSESAAGGRRRKMGSSRKSRGPQKDDDSMMSAQKERDAILTDESVRKTTQEHREESSALEEKLEVDESVKQSSSGVGVSNTPEHSRPLSGKAPERGTPVQRHDAEMRLRQESQKTFSLAGDSRGADIGSKRYNVMLVGDSSVGKTSLMQRAQSGKFSFEIPASIGLDTSLWTVVVDGKPVVLQLWDTAGQERFHSITRQVFHKAQAFLLMYDITCSQSFTAISYWANCIQEAAPEDVTILLLGNKSDSGKRQVNTEEGEILAKEYNFEFMECSAATGDNVIHSLETVARMLSEKDDTSEESMVLHKEPPRSKRSGCC